MIKCVPKIWESVNAQGIDSYVGLIVIDKHDTLSFDLGWYSISHNQQAVLQAVKTLKFSKKRKD